ncbi:MAG TPA: ACT domain-containing protein [Actinophytocola sp.]|uniref:ACT domain-containing protein n=1 Tax=Actinophytocola sp. TaxID=1872138 RepID=UPI002DDD8267|nr:ACT domain-containing protein [Actinophytocola sp.]HEV2784199.1 ACT domain-containing protein [Actinophytocola sp.]
MKRLAVDVRPGDYSIVRLPSGSPPPSGLFAHAGSGLVSVTSTPDEVSVVCPTEHAPAAEQVEHGWRLLTVRGPLEFTLTGIMAALAGELAAAGVSLFAVSTFDTDHVLVKAVDLARAVAALTEAGHDVAQPAG